jgi:N-alpha-acetyl-L-2,4-diaminobutyrate deacetylase
MNYPAFKAGRRTSPIDGGNMNRSFPGKPDGTVTEKIADYFERVLLPKADYVLDFHSGGRTLDFLPFAAAHVLDDKVQEERCVAAMKAFAAPYSMMLLEIDNAGLYDTAAEAQGKVFISTELGGGGTATAASIEIAERGLDNFLKHAGILEGGPEPAPTTMLDMPDHDCFIFAEDEGVLEMVKDLGETVSDGEVIAYIHCVQKTGVEASAYRASRSGLLVGRHHPGLIGIGDCLSVIADILEG